MIVRDNDTLYGYCHKVTGALATNLYMSQGSAPKALIDDLAVRTPWPEKLTPEETYDSLMRRFRVADKENRRVAKEKLALDYELATYGLVRNVPA